MSWQITEDLDTLKFNRYFPELKAFLTIELNHGPDSLNIFEGTVVGDNNEFIASCSGPNFYSVMDLLLNKVQCGF